MKAAHRLATLDDFRNWLIREAARIVLFGHYFAAPADPFTKHAAP